MSRGPDHTVFQHRGWLSQTSPELRAELLSRCDILTVGAGEALYQAGDEPGGLYGVKKGRLDVHLIQRGNTPTLVHIVGPGFWTGEFATITNRPRLIALVARTECTILRLPRAEVYRVAASAPDCWQAVAALAVTNTVLTLDLIDMLKREDASQRIAAALLILAREVPDDPPLIDVSQTELGQLARMSRGTVNAALRGLAAMELISQDYGAIRLPDLGRLEAFVQRG